MIIGRSDQFKKAWTQLSEADKKLARKAIEMMLEDMRYPSLRIKKVKGAGDVWEARASYSMRITFELAQDTIILRNIGKHDDVLKQP
jgi:mRNA interferase RelE/StbE